MFTGIIQAVGAVVGVETAPRPHADGVLAHRLEIELGELAHGLQLGASVAINGVCLTLAERRGTIGSFDAVPETWGRTNLRGLQAGDPVHLENSLRAGDPIDGHFVQGHVDGTGVIDRVDRAHGGWKLWITTEPPLMPFIVPKGSVALDGTSLTVVDVVETRFSVALVPTTLKQTTFGRRQPGYRVNIETDILARLVIGRLAAFPAASGRPDGTSGLSWDSLRAGGFVT